MKKLVLALLLLAAPAYAFKVGGLNWVTTDGTSGQVIKTDGAGNLGWVTPVIPPTLHADAPLVYTEGTTTFSITLATSAASGYLSTTDWNTFNNKAPTASPTFTGTVTGATSTWSGPFSDTSDGAASTPAWQLSGKAYTGGSSTTTKPLALIENATNSNGWSTSGTYLGVNGSSGFTGNLLDLQLNAVSKFLVGSDGSLTDSKYGTGIAHFDSLGNITSSAVDVSSADATGTLAAARFPALTGDVTTSAGSLATSLASTISGAKTFSTSLTSPAFISSSSNAASAGAFRLADTDLIKWRNHANGADVALGKDTSDQLSWAGTSFLSSSGVLLAAAHPALTGDVTNSAGSLSTTIAASAVSNSKMANMANNTVKGNVSGSTAAPSDLTLTAGSTASTVMYRDSNANTEFNNSVPQFTTAATANTTTTLTAASSYHQYFTGSTSGQVLKLPDARTLPDTGIAYHVHNDSSATVAVQDNGGGALQTMAASGSYAIFTAKSTGSQAGSWSTEYTASSGGGGNVTGPGSSHDGGLVLFSGTGGTTIQEATLTQHQVLAAGANNTVVGIAPGSSAGYVMVSNGTDFQATIQPPDFMFNCGIQAAISSNTVVIDLKQSDGSSAPSSTNPCTASFRSTTATTGGYFTQAFTGASQITVGATASLGHTANQAPMNIYVYLIQDATSEICVSNSPFLDDTVLHSATATPATTGSTLYCTNAHTSRPTRLLGMISATWANPNWSSITKVAVVPFKNGFYESTMQFDGSWQGSHTYASSETMRIDTIASDNVGAFNTSTWTYTLQMPAICSVNAGTSYNSLDGVTDANISMAVCGHNHQCYTSRSSSNTSSTGVVDCAYTGASCGTGSTVVVTATGDASYTLDNNGNRTYLSISCVPTPQ